MENKSEKSKIMKELWFILLFLLILILFPYSCLESIPVPFLKDYCINIGKYGDFGQYIGGITSIIAIVLIYLTYKSQKEELRLTSVTLKKQEDEMRKQSEIIDRQTKIMQNQLTISLINYTPNVNINLIRVSATEYDIEVRNVSKVEVFDLEFIDPPDREIYRNFSSNNIGFIKNGIPYMGIEQVYRHTFIYTATDENQLSIKNGDIVKLEFKYYDRKRNDSNRKEFFKEFIFNMNMLENTFANTTFEKDLLERIDKINNNFIDLNKNFKKLNQLTENNVEGNK